LKIHNFKLRILLAPVRRSQAFVNRNIGAQSEKDKVENVSTVNQPGKKTVTQAPLGRRKSIGERAWSFYRREGGATAIECSLIAALISVTLILTFGRIDGG